MPGFFVALIDITVMVDWALTIYLGCLCQCLGQSWYLANDMQFYVLSPLIFVPFYL